MTYGTVAAAPLALPLGELSPKVTERALQAFLNGDVNLCAHAAKIHINISVGKTQDLQSKRCQKYGHVFPSQSAAPTALPKGEPSSARNALHRTVYRSAPLLSVRQTGSCRSVRLHIIIWQDKLQEQPQHCKLLWLFAALRAPTIVREPFCVRVRT